MNVNVSFNFCNVSTMSPPIQVGWIIEKLFPVMFKHLIHIWIIQQFILSCVRLKLFIKVIYKANHFTFTLIIPTIHLLQYLYLNNTFTWIIPKIHLLNFFHIQNFYFFFLVVELQLQFELLITVLLFEIYVIINY